MAHSTDREQVGAPRLLHAIISADAWMGFTLTTADGHPATLAIVDESGNILESGPVLATELWAVAVASYRNFLIRKKALKVWSEPSGRFQEREDT